MVSVFWMNCTLHKIKPVETAELTSLLVLSLQVWHWSVCLIWFSTTVAISQCGVFLWDTSELDYVTTQVLPSQGPGWSPQPASVSNAARNIVLPFLLSLTCVGASTGYGPKSAPVCYRLLLCMFNFKRSHKTHFQSGCTNSHVTRTTHQGSRGIRSCLPNSCG